MKRKNKELDDILSKELFANTKTEKETTKVSIMHGIFNGTPQQPNISTQQFIGDLTMGVTGKMKLLSSNRENI